MKVLKSKEKEIKLSTDVQRFLTGPDQKPILIAFGTDQNGIEYLALWESDVENDNFILRKI